MKPLLLKIPGVDAVHETEVQIRALSVDGKSEVFATLAEWAKSEKSDHRKIIHAMRVTAQTKRGFPVSENHFKGCSNLDYGDVFEFRAHKGSARVMFFYDTPELIICTNTFWKMKSSDKQDTAFKHCAAVRNAWNKLKPAQPHEPKRLDKR